jgi:hypothetical protein
VTQRGRRIRAAIIDAAATLMYHQLHAMLPDIQRVLGATPDRLRQPA